MVTRCFPVAKIVGSSPIGVACVIFVDRNCSRTYGGQGCCLVVLPERFSFVAEVYNAAVSSHTVSLGLGTFPSTTT